MTDQLSLYNNALGHLEEGELASLSEDRAPRRRLDAAFESVVLDCLGQGDWNFAIRSVLLAESNAIETQWGGSVAHKKPDDWVRTVSLSYSELGYNVPDISDEGQVWVTRPGELYVRYVSKDPQKGFSLGDWPQSFTTYVEYALAKKVQPRVRPGDTLKQTLFEMTKRALFDAQNADAANEGSRTIPYGRLTRSRGGGFGDLYYMGNRRWGRV